MKSQRDNAKMLQLYIFPQRDQLWVFLHFFFPYVFLFLLNVFSEAALFFVHIFSPLVICSYEGALRPI